MIEEYPQSSKFRLMVLKNNRTLFSRYTDLQPRPDSERMAEIDQEIDELEVMVKLESGLFD